MFLTLTASTVSVLSVVADVAILSGGACTAVYGILKSIKTDRE